MKLAEIDLGEIVDALRMERSAWIKKAQDQGRENTEAESVTICVLMALEHAFASIAYR